MFTWLRRFFGPQQPVDVHIHVHVDGVLKVTHEGGSGLPNRIMQGSQDTPPATISGTEDIRKHPSLEEDIKPEFFAGIDTPAVAFGTDIELPDSSKGDSNQDH